MTYKKIIDQFPGHTIYQAENPGHVYHFFRDTYCCPITGSEKEIPGKGALSQRISSFLFSKLSQMHIPNHFLGARNMRESLMQATQPLPFSLRIHIRAGADLSADFHVPEDTVFDPPLIEYVTASTRYHANDDFLMAMGWVDQDDIDEIHGLALRATHCLQGLLIASDFSMIEMHLNLARSFEDPFVVAGNLTPETLVLRDLRTGNLLTMASPENADSPCLASHILLARRLGIYAQGAQDPVAYPQLGIGSNVRPCSTLSLHAPESFGSTLPHPDPTPIHSNILPFPNVIPIIKS